MSWAPDIRDNTLRGPPLGGYDGVGHNSLMIRGTKGTYSKGLGIEAGHVCEDFIQRIITTSLATDYLFQFKTVTEEGELEVVSVTSDDDSSLGVFLE